MLGTATQVGTGIGPPQRTVLRTNPQHDLPEGRTRDWLVLFKTQLVPRGIKEDVHLGSQAGLAAEHIFQLVDFSPFSTIIVFPSVI